MHTPYRFFFTILLLTALSITFPAMAAPAQEKAADILKIAQTEFQTKKFDSAKTAYGRVVLAPDADVDMKAAAHIGIANILLRGEKPQPALAREECEKALALPGLPTHWRLPLLFLTATTYERMSPANWDEAISLYEKIAAEPGGDNKSKITALNKISQAYTAKGEAQKATDTLNRSLALPDLKPLELLTALANKGALFLNQGKYQAARDTYQKMIDTDPSDRNQANVQKLIIRTWTAEGNLGRAIELALQGQDGLELAYLYQKQGDAKAAQLQLLTILNDRQADFKLKITAFNRLMTLYAATDDYAQARKDVATFLPQLSDSDPNQPAALLPLIRSAMETGNYESASWAAAVTMNASKLSDRDYMLVRLWLVNSLGALGRLDEACKIAETAAADEKLAIADRFRFKLTADALASTGRIDEMKNAYARTLGLFKGYTPTAKEKANVMLNAAKSALMAGKNHAASELYNLHQALFLKELPVSYVCDFMNEAPSDVAAWLASSLLKDPKKEAKINRKYGKNLAFLLGTDASTTGRGVAAEGSGSDNTQTDLHMACDANGIHFFFKTIDPRADEVKSQLVSGGSYEGYLAPGTNKPYYCFLIDLPTGSLKDSFPTMYPNRSFRQAQVQNGTIISSTLPTKDGFATYLFYSWELFYDNLPANGDKWQFETIRWTRSGGFSWAGSQSVHNRSSWGNIVFNGLTENNLRAIKRNLIFKALANYEKEKSPKTKGAIDFWKDAELGDRQFYNTELAPLVTKLDDFERISTKDISGTDIETLFEQAVPDWMEFKYRVEELRYKSLSDKYLIQN